MSKPDSKTTKWWDEVYHLFADLPRFGKLGWLVALWELGVIMMIMGSR